MSRLRSRIPRIDGMDEPVRRYLEDLDRRIPSRSDLSASATLAEVITAVNSLYADLRTAGIMEQ